MCTRKAKTMQKSLLPFIFGYFGVSKRGRHKNKYSFEERFEYLRNYFKKIVDGYQVEYIKFGTEYMPDKASLVVSNHNATYDPLVLMLSLKYPTMITSKIENKDARFIRTVLNSVDAYYIDREDARQAFEIFKKMYNDLSTKTRAVCIYPEGTRNKEHPETLLPFREASFKAAIKAGADINPIVTYGTKDIRNFKLKVKRIPIIISYLPPITAKDYEGKSTYEVSSMIQDMMQKELTEHILPIYNEKMNQK